VLVPWLSLAMFYIVCFLKSWAVNRKLAGLWLLDDLHNRIKKLKQQT